MSKRKNRINSGVHRFEVGTENLETAGAGVKGLLSTLGTVSKIAAIAAGADKLAGAFASAIDANRAGVSDVPTVISEGVLGGHEGSYIGNLLSRGRKKQEALNYINQQGNLGYSANNTGDLMSQFEGPLQKANINTWGNIGGARRQDEINSAIDAANVRRYASFDLANQNLTNNETANFLASYFANGGLLSNDFDNGVISINQGGTHENNPHEGVQIGIAPDGKPNLVEEGEAIYNDYVFSNRLRVPKEVRNKYKLRGPKDMTFAEAFRWAQKESEERPNDNISENGLDNIAMILARTQEAVREYNGAVNSHKAANGGHLFATGTTVKSFPAEIVDEKIEDEPEVRDAIDSFWKRKLGEAWDSSDARKLYLDTLGLDAGLGNKVDWRYATPLVQAGTVLSDLAGWTNKPTEFNYIPPFSEVQFRPLGNYLAPTYFDTRYAANRQAQQAAAAKNAIMQRNTPDRNAALLANTYAAQVAQGDMLMEAAQQQYANDLQRAQFNRGTDQYNSEGFFKRDVANQDSRLKYATAALQQAQLADQAETLSYMGKAKNLENLAESLGDITRDKDAKKFIFDLARAGVFGALPFGFGISANGGKIRRKKKGLTC